MNDFSYNDTLYMLFSTSLVLNKGSHLLGSIELFYLQDSLHVTSRYWLKKRLLFKIITSENIFVIRNLRWLIKVIFKSFLLRSHMKVITFSGDNVTLPRESYYVPIW